MEDKPISLNSLVFVDSKGMSIVAEDYQLTFCNHTLCERFIKERHRYWKDVLKMELSINPDLSETMKDLEVLKVLELVCEKVGVDYLWARTKTQKGEAIVARRHAMVICYGRKMNKSNIAKALGFTHATVIHHLKEHNNICAYNRVYLKDFIDLEDEVLTSLTEET